MIGTKVKNLKGEAQYESYQPIVLNELLAQVQTNEEVIAKLNSIHQLKDAIKMARPLLPNHTQKQLMLVNFLESLALENMHVSLSELSNLKTSFHPRKETILHFIEANDYLMHKRQRLPLSVRFIKDAHYAFFSEEHVFDQYAGELKRSQNWISNQNKPLAQADYVPPNVEDTKRLMDDLELFIHQHEVDPFLMASLALYQFESIQPFLSGNGLMSRFLVDSLISEFNLPCLRLSKEIKANKTRYDELILNVKETQKIELFIVFVLDLIEKGYRLTLAFHKGLKRMRQKNSIVIRQHESDKTKRKQLASTLLALEASLTHPVVEDKVFQTLHELGLIILQKGLMSKLYSHKNYINLLQEGS